MIQAEIKFQDSGACIIVFGRDKDGNRTRHIHKFQHYFYIPEAKVIIQLSLVRKFDEYQYINSGLPNKKFKNMIEHLK